MLVAEQGVLVAPSQQTAVDQQAVLARRNFKVGAGTVADVHEARSRQDLARAQAITAYNEGIVRHAELARIVGATPRQRAGLRSDWLPPTPQPASVAP